MLITIYDRIGNFKAEVSPSDSSTQVKEIQGDNILTLSFTHHEHFALDVDDYCDFEGERYRLMEAFRPEQKSTLEWGYDIKLYGIESAIKNILVLKNFDGENDPVFTLTAPPREHVAMIVKCMNDGAGHITDWKVGQVDGTENIVIDYHGKYCDEALREIAEKVGAEWWVEGQTVNVCRCQHGEQIELGYDKGLTGIIPDKADNVKFYTRLFPVGSSRNIDPEKYGYTRLQLPGGEKYVEVNADKYGRVDHYEDAAFADIYPRRTGEVSSVRSEVKTGEDGKPFTIYYFRDNNLPFDPNDYEIGGLVKRVSFQEGSELGGLGDEDNGTYYFEVNFNSDTREFEVITIWPYDDDTQLPGGNLIPKVGDKYILWNIRMPDEYYALAEEELLTAVNKYNEEHAIDVTVFKCPTDHVWIEENDVDLFVGRRVRLESEQYFPATGYRDSRITKITRKVNLPSLMDIEIGDALSRTSMQKMSDNIKDARSYAKSIGESVALPEIIRTGDQTRPTDNNLFSARRIQAEFMSKTKDDRSKGQIASDKGFEIGDYLAGVSGAKIGNDAETGQTFGEMDKLFVRIKAYFEALTIIESGTMAGKVYVTPGDSVKCTKVEETATTWRCYYLSEQDGEKTETKMIAGDQAISEMFNAKSGVVNKIGNHRYWRLVVAVNNDAYTDESGNHYGYIELSKTDCEANSDIPSQGDVINQFGNRTDATRRAAMVFSTVDADAPSIKLFTGIGSGNTNAEHYSLAGHDIISYGYDPVKGNAYFRCYGDLYLGARDGSTFVRYNEKDEKFEFDNVSLSLNTTIGDKPLNEYFLSLIPDSGLDYIKQALVQNSEYRGGLIMSTMLALGYNDSSGERHTMAGMNGSWMDSLGGRTIASWWGGDMIDRFDVNGNLISPIPVNAATSLIRMDGSAYWANGNFGFEADGSGWLGKYKDGIIINPDGSLTVGSGLTFNVSNVDGLKTMLDSFANFSLGIQALFAPCDANDNEISWEVASQSDGAGGIRAKSLKSKVGLWTPEYMSAKGKNPDGGTGTGGGMDETALEAYLTQYGYATQQWVRSQGYLIGHQDISHLLSKTLAAATYLSKTDAAQTYLSKTDAQSLYQPKGNYLTQHQALNHINFIDRRSTNFAPYATGQYLGVEYQLKSNSADGLNDGQIYHGVLNLHAWSDKSAGAAHQMAFTDNGNVWLRHGRDAWAAWRRLAFVEELTWAKISGKPNLVTLDTAQTISGFKTITAASPTGPYGFNVAHRLRDAYSTSIEVSGGNYTMGLGCHKNGSWYWWRGTTDPATISDKAYVMEFNGTMWQYYHTLQTPRVNLTGGLSGNGYITASAVNEILLSAANKDMLIIDGANMAVRPGVAVAGQVSLGTDVRRWSNVYANTINVTSTGLVGNLNADMLDGAHYRNILERDYTASKLQSVTVTKWYRVAQFIGTNAAGAQGLLMVSRNYNSPSNEAYTFSIALGYHGEIVISQLSGQTGGHLIDKIRVTYNNSGAAYVDVHVAHSGYANLLLVTTIGALKTLDITEDPAVMNATKEYATHAGIGNEVPAKTYTDGVFFGSSSLGANQVCNVTFGKARSGGDLGYIGHRHVADGSNQNMIVLGGYNYDNLMCVRYDGRVGIGTIAPAHKLDVAGDIHASGWLRTTGNTGWYSQTYGGGFYMTDSSYIKNYNKKRLKIEGLNDYFGIWLEGSGVCCEGYTGTSWSNGHAALNVGVYDNGSQTPLVMAYRRGAAAHTGANRLFAMELLNSGVKLAIGFGGVHRFVLSSDGTFYAQKGAYSDGYMSALGQNTGSDIRLKTWIADVALPLGVIASAPAWIFRWRPEVGVMAGRIDAGTTAQYWQQWLPQVVSQRKDKYLQIDYAKTALLSAIMIARYMRDYTSATDRRIMELEATCRRQAEEIKRLNMIIKDMERRLAA